MSKRTLLEMLETTECRNCGRDIGENSNAYPTGLCEKCRSKKNPDDEQVSYIDEKRGRPKGKKDTKPRKKFKPSWLKYTIFKGMK